MVDIFTPNTSPRAENDECQVAPCGAPGTTCVGAWAWRALRDGTLDKMTTLGVLDDLVDLESLSDHDKTVNKLHKHHFGRPGMFRQPKLGEVPGKWGVFSVGQMVDELDERSQLSRSVFP